MNQIAKTKKAIKAVRVRPMSREVADVRHNINMIQEAMQATMKKDVHYGIIPGCGKPSLYKSGAETLIALFKLSFTPKVENLSEDGEIRYLVTMELSTREGVYIGSGIGECSSGEEKYMWRGSICEEEFEAAPETLRRIKFKKNYKTGIAEQIQQIRVNPSDMANTILKMAKKRALIDAVLTATGASDIFAQDIEDLPEGFIDPEMAKITPVSEDNSKPEPEPEKTEFVDSSGQISPKKHIGDVISEPQRKRLYAIAKGSGMEDGTLKEWLSISWDYESSKDILKKDYEQICTEAADYGKGWGNE